MRRISLLLLATMLFTTLASAQTSDRFAIKVQPFFGSYLDKNNHHFEKLGRERLD